MRAKFAENVDVIDKHAAVRVTQFFFDLQNRWLIKNLRVRSAYKSEKKFQLRTFLQFQPRAPGVVVENTRSQMRDCIIMSDLCCTKKARHKPRQRSFLWEQNSNALTIPFAEELGRERDNGTRLLGGVGSDEKMHFGQLIFLLGLGLCVRVSLGKDLSFPVDFLPG